MIDLFPNSTVIFQWILFILTLIVLNKGLFKPIFKILQERQARTLGEREKARHYEQKAHELLDLCQKKIEGARQLGERKKDEALVAAEQFTESLLKKTRKEVDSVIEETRLKIERESREASMQLKQYAQQISREITAEVLERPL